MKKQWYILKTLPRCEMKVKNLLINKGAQADIPLYKQYYQRLNKKYTKQVPLITNYVFVWLLESELEKYRYIPGSKGWLTWNNKPCCLSEENLDQLHKISQGDVAPIITSEVGVGELVVIESGVLTGIQGQVLISDKKYLIIETGIKNYRLKIELDKVQIKKL